MQTLVPILAVMQPLRVLRESTHQPRIAADQFKLLQPATFIRVVDISTGQMNLKLNRYLITAKTTMFPRLANSHSLKTGVRKRMLRTFDYPHELILQSNDRYYLY